MSLTKYICDIFLLMSLEAYVGANHLEIDDMLLEAILQHSFSTHLFLEACGWTSMIVKAKFQTP